MLERGHGVCLTAKALARSAAGRVYHAHHFQRDLPAKLGVARTEHRGHRPVAERTEDFITAEGCAGGGRCEGRWPGDGRAWLARIPRLRGHITCLLGRLVWATPPALRRVFG